MQRTVLCSIMPFFWSLRAETSMITFTMRSLNLNAVHTLYTQGNKFVNIQCKGAVPLTTEGYAYSAATCCIDKQTNGSSSA